MRVTCLMFRVQMGRTGLMMACSQRPSETPTRSSWGWTGWISGGDKYLRVVRALCALPSDRIDLDIADKVGVGSDSERTRGPLDAACV